MCRDLAWVDGAGMRRKHYCGCSLLVLVVSSLDCVWMFGYEAPTVRLRVRTTRTPGNRPFAVFLPGSGRLLTIRSRRGKHGRSRLFPCSTPDKKMQHQARVSLFGTPPRLPSSSSPQRGTLYNVPRLHLICDLMFLLYMKQAACRQSCPQLCKQSVANTTTQGFGGLRRHA